MKPLKTIFKSLTDRCFCRQGFSMIELMIVIAIIGIIAGIGIPNLIKYRPRAQLKKAARDLYSNMQLARVKAMRDSSQWAVQFDTDAGAYSLLSDEGADEDWNTIDDEIFKSVDLAGYAGVSYGTLHGPRTGATSNPSDGVSFSANRVIFNSNGTSKSGTIYINNGSDTYAVGSASNAGRVKAWHNYGGVWVE